MPEMCEVCGAPDCWALTDWSVEDTSDYQEARADHFSLGYERSQEALAAANARANHAETNLVAVREMLATHVEEKLAAQEALTAARRESTLYRGVIDNLLSVMEMQEKRESGAFHITGEVMFGIWSDAKEQARAALGAPAAAAGEEDGNADLRDAGEGAPRQVLESEDSE